VGRALGVLAAFAGTGIFGYGVVNVIRVLTGN
jgi:hypothetical protein